MFELYLYLPMRATDLEMLTRWMICSSLICSLTAHIPDDVVQSVQQNFPDVERTLSPDSDAGSLPLDHGSVVTPIQDDILVNQ